MTKNQYAAYTVFRGKVPGVYDTWEECQEQTQGQPKNKYIGYDSIYQAQLAWADWQKKLAVKAGASTFLQQTTANSKTRPVQTAPFWTDSPNGRLDRVQPANLPPRTSPVPRLSQKSLHPDSSPPTPYIPSIARSQLQNTPPPSSSPDFIPRVKRMASYGSDEEDWSPPSKKYKDMGEEVTAPVLSREERYELEQLDKQKASGKPLVEESKVMLTPEQDKVVNLALRKNNIFLTGAAGSGKTVTLKEILRRIRKRKKGGKVEVIAPTGIAALPLGGRTTYSFAGWNPDSFRDGIEDLLKKPRPRVLKAINELDVLVIEEISMVENLFLERLNLLFQRALANKLPFGGKQVIFLGDFHQLPPVLPFQNCMLCGQNIPRKEKPLCTSRKCIAGDTEPPNFTWNDKWAFKSSVWKELKLRHIKLEQIHRQKDTNFQDILNKIRNGITLSVEEWSQLERPKQLPNHAYAVRLMSRLDQVRQHNESELARLTSQPKTWTANDSVRKLIETVDGRPVPINPNKIEEYKGTLRDHRFPVSLTLKVGARVVLLQNLSHDKGLVNGSQGVVIGFAPAPNELNVMMDGKSPHQKFEMDSMMAFQATNHKMRPLVRFANGVTELITGFAQSSIRGDVLDKMEQYVVTRTQIPLTLAWALSIHKSQGMTLEYVEVLSRDIFESGQLYVALSRATHLNGLRVTGFKRQQLPMDPDVLEFYNETKWEKLERPNKKGAKVLGASSSADDPIVLD